MNPDRKHPEQDPAEGARDVVDHQLKREDGNGTRTGKGVGQRDEKDDGEQRRR